MMRISALATVLALVLGSGTLLAQSGASSPDPTLHRSGPAVKPPPPQGATAPGDPTGHRIPAVPRFKPLGTPASRVHALGTDEAPEVGMEPDVDPTLHRSREFGGGVSPELHGAGDLGQQKNPEGQPVPEPETWALFLLGLSLLGFAAWKRGLLDEFLASAPGSR